MHTFFMQESCKVSSQIGQNWKRTKEERGTSVILTIINFLKLKIYTFKKRQKKLLIFSSEKFKRQHYFTFDTSDC